MKPTIAVAAHTDLNQFGSSVTTIPFGYTRAIEKAGGIPLILPFTRDMEILAQMAAHAHGFLFPGGYDLDPGFFGQSPDPALGRVDRDLDEFQLALFDLAIARKAPVLGICRGAQVINVALGGDLHQDIPTQFPESDLTHMQEQLHHGTDHEVSFEPGSRLYQWFGPRIPINSRHHQSIKKPGRDLKITAFAPDRVVEGAEHLYLPIDLIQWHPELMLHKDDAMLPLFTGFVDNCRCQMEQRTTAL